MKKIVCFVLILSLFLALSAGLFACKNKEPVVVEKDKNTLAAAVVDKAFPDGRDDKEEIKTALLALLEDAELEDAETISVLSGMCDSSTDLSAVLLDVKNADYTIDRFAGYRGALQIVAVSVSPEIAGRVFYAAASKTAESLSYTMSDCEKIASLFLGDNDLFDLGQNFIDEKTVKLNERQINTAIITVVSALRKAVGISAEAKTFLRSFAKAQINKMVAERSATLTTETQEALKKSKEFLEDLTDVFINNYDEILSFTADYLAQTDARLVLGLPYEKQECMNYYGYTKSTWTRTVITKEQYEARAGGYDEYFALNEMSKGFTVNGVFLPISDEDAALADQAYRLYAAYKAYALLNEEQKAACKETIHAVLTVLAKQEGAVASILGCNLSDTPATATVSIDELLLSLPALSAFDATDGVSAEERNAAQDAVWNFVDYLHGYFPKIEFDIA